LVNLKNGYEKFELKSKAKAKANAQSATHCLSTKSNLQPKPNKVCPLFNPQKKTPSLKKQNFSKHKALRYYMNI